MAFSTTQMSTGIEPKYLKLNVFELAFLALVKGANSRITDGLTFSGATRGESVKKES